MKRHLYIIVSAAAVVTCTILASSTLVPHPAELVRSSSPVFSADAERELGVCERGMHTTARFNVANPGATVLRLSEFRMSCSCESLTVEGSGEVGPDDEVLVPPGDTVVLEWRLKARAPIGAVERNMVFFRTNDPARPQASLSAIISKVTGGISAFPVVVEFGEVPQGVEARRVVDILDFAQSPRR